MKMITGLAIPALMMALVACGHEDETTIQTVSGAATFRAMPAISGTVDALPRLVGESAAVRAINADLDRRDAAARAESCDGEGEYERGVMQPMTGPGFITFWISEGYYCLEAAHPGFNQSAITYDLATGRTVDWVTAAPGLNLKRGGTSLLPETYIPTLSSAALTNWYSRKMLASTDTEWLDHCGDVLTVEALGDAWFWIWLDAESGGLSVSPELGYAVKNCADSATMTSEEMREVGVPTAMIEAVAVAHAAGNWAPKDNDR